MGWRRNLAQRLFVRFERARERSLEIVPGTPLARRFAAFGEGSHVDPPQLFLTGAAATSIGRHVYIRRFFALEVLAPAGSPPLVVIEDGVNIGHYVRFVSVNGIRIGRQAGIGHGVTLADTTHDYKGQAEATGWHAPLVVGRPMTIGEGAWVGNNCIVAGGLTIGEGAIVAPNSWVSRDVPPETLVGGNPTRVLRRKSPSGAWEPVEGTPLLEEWNP
jgi:lipopolysaccharide O-acetyltransferase